MSWHFAAIFILAALTYRLGFAQKLPVIKTFIIYVFLFVGTFPLVFFNALGLPMIPALCTAVCVLLVARIRGKLAKETCQRGR